MQSSNEEILLTVMTEDLQGIKDIEAIAALDGVDLISLGPTDLSTALGITNPKDPRWRQTVEEGVGKVNRIGKAKVYLPVYHAAFYLTPQELVQMGVSYTSVAPPPPTIVLNALRESAQRIREQAQQRGHVHQQVGAYIVFVKLGGLGTPRCGFDWHTRAKPLTSAELAEATRFVMPHGDVWAQGPYDLRRCMIW